MSETDNRQDQRHSRGGAVPPKDLLEAEIVSLRLLLAQAEIDAQELLAQAGIDAEEREAADKLQKLILEELHHRIKNTLATVSAIASQSLRNVPGPNMRSRPSRAGYWRSGKLTTSFCRRGGAARISAKSCTGRRRLSTIWMRRNSRLPDPMSV
jgi:hypothetical protein